MAWSHLLAATDDSSSGQHALRVAEGLAARSGARLTITTVAPIPAQSRVLTTASMGGASMCPRTGIPGIEIVRLANEVRADLIVLGRACGGAVRPRLGTTADAVVRRSDVPCLFVPPGHDRVKRILTALDGGERSLVVFAGAEAFQAMTGGPLGAVTVEPGSNAAAYGSEVRVSSTRAHRMERWFQAAGRSMPDMQVRHGDPVASIGGAIREWEADVLVVGAHRGGPSGPPDSTGVGRSLLYTTTCAVLTVPL